MGGSALRDRLSPMSSSLRTRSSGLGLALLVLGLLLGATAGCGGDAPSTAAATSDAELPATAGGEAPMGAPLDAPPTAAPEFEDAAVDAPASDGDASEAPIALEELYTDEQVTGSADERDALAAAALGPEVLALRQAAKDRAEELAELSADSDYAFVDFERLVFEGYTPPEFRAAGSEPLDLANFPEDVRGLHGQKVQLAGFMIAVDFKNKQIEDFMLCRFPPGCCFGGVPLFDEWVDCTPNYAEKRDWSPYEMILVEGTLEVGEVVDEDGFALSIYRMRVDDVRPFD